MAAVFVFIKQTFPLARLVRIVVFIVAPLFWFFFSLVGLHRGTAGNPARYNAENLELLESGLWFTSDTSRQEHADVADEITAKGEVR
jgi:hypothetical protein